MPFALPSAFNWLEHRLLRARRVLFRRKNSHYIEQYNSARINVLRDCDGRTLLCPICGYSMAEVQLEQNWSLRGCSAEEFKGIFPNKRLVSWQMRLFKRCNSSKAAFNNNLAIFSK